MKKVALILGITLFFGSCKEPFIESEVSKQNDDSEKGSLALRKSTDESTDKELILGKKLENPYSVKNMELALGNLKAKGGKFEVNKISENYRYVRLLPSNQDEFNTINADKSIDIFEYPLDYEILKQGNKYKDKSLEGSNYTWLYCAVPLNKEFDKRIKMEVLESLFLPFGNGKEKVRLSADETEFYKSLENEAMILTKNETKSVKKGKVADWSASGRIRVWDERLGGGSFVNVDGCKVRANRWFTTKIGFTDTNGNFLIDHGWGNGNPVNYSIKWDRDGFDIRSGPYGQAYFNGPNLFGAWNLDIEEGGTPDNYIYAHVHRAAFEYYYHHNDYGIQAPPDDNYFAGLGILGLIGHKMHLGAEQSGWLNFDSHYFNFNDNFFAAEVRLFFDLNNEDGRSIFGTTIHELAHTSHWKLGFTTAHFVADATNRKLAESWAQAVGWHITRATYGLNNPVPWNDFDAGSQLNTLNDIQNGSYIDRIYTPIFIDLLDNFDQSTEGVGRPNDVVFQNTYTIGQLEGFLMQSPTNWYGYRNIIQNNVPFPDGNTPGDAVWLFTNYD